MMFPQHVSLRARANKLILKHELLDVSKIAKDYVIVTGASGFIGQILVQELMLQNVHVIAASRTPQNLPASTTRVYADNVGANADWTNVLQLEEKARTAVHLANAISPNARLCNDINYEGTLNFARQAAQHGIKRFVFPSPWLSHKEIKDSLPKHLPGGSKAYMESKIAAEAGLLEIAKDTGMEVVIIKTPLVYGPGVGGFFYSLMKHIYRGTPLPLEITKSPRAITYVRNLTSAITFSMFSPYTANKVLYVRDAEMLTAYKIIERLAQLMDKEARVISASRAIAAVAAKLFNILGLTRRFSKKVTIDDSFIRTLGWQAPYTMAQGFEETVEWFLQNRKK